MEVKAPHTQHHWLVDRANDGAPRARDVADAAHDDPGGAGVESRRGLVAEDQQRVGHELHRLWWWCVSGVAQKVDTIPCVVDMEIR